MKIGINLPVMARGFSQERFYAWCEAADEGFFSSLAIGERIAFFNPEQIVALSVAAALTKRVQLVMNVAIPPAHQTVRLAKQIATLDVLSNGRVVVGVGIGGRDQDYEAVGVTLEHKRLGRLGASVEEMRRVWRGETIVEGQLPVGPPTTREGGPEVLAGSLMMQSIQRSARWADGLVGFSFGPSATEIAFQFKIARDAWAAAGRTTPPRLLTGFWYALGDNARVQMDEYLREYLNFMAPSASENVAKICTSISGPAICDAIKQIADVGADEVLLVPTTSDPDDLRRVREILSASL